MRANVRAVLDMDGWRRGVVREMTNWRRRNAARESQKQGARKRRGRQHDRQLEDEAELDRRQRQI
jgi:hypothetical protein